MPSDGSPTYVSTPHGLFTAAGRWYHLPEEEAREYAGEVLEHVSLETLVRWADAWLDSPRTVTLWALPPLLWALPAGWALGTALALYVGWALVSPALPAVSAARAATGLRGAVLQGGYYVLVLSILAARQQYGAVGAGLGAFVLFRWGVVDWLARALLDGLRARLYPLPIPDQVLRGLIVRAALKYRVSVPQVDALTADILQNWGAQGSSDPPADAPPTDAPPTDAPPSTDDSSRDSHA
jgi:hypothetical protein